MSRARLHIVDAQVHIWAADSPMRPWPPGRHAPHSPVPLSAADLLVEMDRAGVAGAVLVPPSWEGDRNDLVLAAAKAHPRRFAAMGRVDPDDAASVRGVLQWRDHPGALGLRLTLHRPGMSELLTDGRLDAIWQNAAIAGVPLMVLMPQSKMELLHEVLRRHPRLELVLDHLGVPSTVPMAERFTHLQRLTALAKYPNVTVKASALPSLAADAYPYASLHEPLRAVIEAFGPQRVFWGTDFSRLPCSYTQAITMFTEEMPWLDDGAMAQIMGRALIERFGMTI